MARVEGVEVVQVGSPLVPVVGAVVQLLNPDGSAASHYDQKTGGVVSTADLATDVFGRIRRADGGRWYIDEGQDYRLAWSGGAPPVAPGERWLAGISGEHVPDVSQVHGVSDMAALAADVADHTARLPAVESDQAAIKGGRLFARAPTGVEATDQAEVQGNLDEGGAIVLQEGIYQVAGITFENKSAYLVGPGGMAQAGSSAPFVAAPCKLKSAVNAPIVKFEEDDYTSIQSQMSGLIGVGIEGNPAIGTAQHGVWVNNRGALLRDVEIGGCGGNGYHTTDSVGGIYERVTSHHNAGEGFALIGGTGVAGTDSPLAAVTTNVFLGAHAYGNGLRGWLFEGQANGNIVVGSNVEGNGAGSGGGHASVWFAIRGANTPKWNRMYGVWLEVVQATSLLADAGAYNNSIDLTRGEGTYSGFGTSDRNIVRGEHGETTIVLPTASLPAAGAVPDGTMLLEDAGAGNRNLIMYAGGQRFRIDGGAAV